MLTVVKGAGLWAQDGGAMAKQAGAAGHVTAGANRPVSLWPEGAPGALGKSDADVPTLTVYLPASNPTRTAVIVAPGGGYQHLALDHEGQQIAEWLNAHGVAAAVLKYRLGPAYHHPVELGDAKRAVRYVRSHAAELGVAADHVGMLGFSAGGHLTATAGTQFDSGDSGSADPVERMSTRPDFLVLCYPVITMAAGSVAHGGSVQNLLGEHPTAEQRALLSAEEHVTKRTPPTFLWSTTDDAAVPVENTVLFYSALVKNHVPAEMHVFPHGRHGLGLAKGEAEVSVWPELLLAWMRANKWAE